MELKKTVRIGPIRHGFYLSLSPKQGWTRSRKFLNVGKDPRQTTVSLNYTRSGSPFHFETVCYNLGEPFDKEGRTSK